MLCVCAIYHFTKSFNWTFFLFRKKKNEIQSQRYTQLELPEGQRYVSWTENIFFLLSKWWLYCKWPSLIYFKWKSIFQLRKKKTLNKREKYQKFPSFFVFFTVSICMCRFLSSLCDGYHGVLFFLLLILFCLFRFKFSILTLTLYIAFTSIFYGISIMNMSRHRDQ